MLEQAFQDVYTKFKLHFYQNVFQRFATREATLTTVESFCMEGIMAMGEPTIAEFSRMMQISTPNAAYKIGSLVKKGSCAAVCYVITGIAQAFLGANGSLFTSLILLAVAIAVELVVLSVIRVRTNKKAAE